MRLGTRGEACVSVAWAHAEREVAEDSEDVGAIGLALEPLVR